MDEIIKDILIYKDYLEEMDELTKFLKVLSPQMQEKFRFIMLWEMIREPKPTTT